jgi:hypothetical protein
MKKLLIIAACCATLIVGCSRREPADTVESLVANPERLKELRTQCKADHSSVGEVQCNAVAEATRRRFMSGGKSPYASDPVPASAPPASASSAGALKG